MWWYFIIFIIGVIVGLGCGYGYLVYKFFYNEDDKHEPMVG